MGDDEWQVAGRRKGGPGRDRGRPGQQGPQRAPARDDFRPQQGGYRHGSQGALNRPARGGLQPQQSAYRHGSQGALNRPARGGFQQGRAPRRDESQQNRPQPQGGYHGAERSDAFEVVSSLPFREHSVRLRQKLSVPDTKRGEEVSLIANCFKLNLDPKCPIYQYTLSVRSEGISPRYFSQDVVRKYFEADNVRYFHDSVKVKRSEETAESRNEQLHRIYTIGQPIALPRPVTELTVRNHVFQVELSPSEKMISFEEIEKYYRQERPDIPTEILTTLNIGFGDFLRKRFQLYQRAYFEYDRVLFSMTDRHLIDIVAGFRTSIIKCEFGLALNLHPAVAAVIPKQFETVADVYRFCNDHRKMNNFQKLMSKVRVTAVHTKRSYRVESVGRVTPRTKRLSMKDGSEQTVEEYFKITYNIKLDPSLPLVCMKEKMRHDGKEDNILLPMELCGFTAEDRFISHNHLSPFIRDRMKHENTKKPEQYFNLIHSFIKLISEDSNAQNAMHNVVVKQAFCKVSGEVLEAPSVLPSGSENRFFRNAPNIKWAIGILVAEWDVKRFKRDLLDEARKHCMQLEEPAFIKEIQPDERAIDALFQELQTKGIKLVVFGTNSDEDSMEERFDCTLYDKLKYFSEIRYGIICQCMDTAKTGKRGYAANFLLKINAKMGGVNQAIDMAYLRKLPFEASRTMVVGLDVNHSSSGEHAVSVASAVGSMDPQFHRYTSTCRIQPNDDYEYLGQLDNMLGELLDAYYECNKKRYPDNLIIFRDGVGEGQMMGQGKKWSVMHSEVPLIRKALAERKLTNVKLTLLVVQKRHTIRLALKNLPKNSRDRTNFNATMGTVVCQMVVDPAYKTFILYSHKCPMGTSKPQIYTVLLDELKMSDDFYTITDFCMAMCGICFRTTNSISIPTAIRYADLCAYKAKGHLLAHRHFNECELQEVDQEAIRVHPNLKYSLHFI